MIYHTYLLHLCKCSVDEVRKGVFLYLRSTLWETNFGRWLTPYAHFLKRSIISQKEFLLLFKMVEMLNRKHISLEKWNMFFSFTYVPIFAFSGQSQFRVKRSDIFRKNDRLPVAKNNHKTVIFTGFFVRFFAKYIKKNIVVTIEEIIYPNKYYLFRYISKIRKIRDFQQNCRLDKARKWA